MMRFLFHMAIFPVTVVARFTQAMYWRYTCRKIKLHPETPGGSA
jgi:hypothetical protein